jgi:hypothetical protein
MAVTYGIGLEANVGSGQLPALATSLFSAFNTSVMPNVSAKYTHTRCVVRAGQSGLVPDLVAEANGSQIGGGSSSPLPQNTAMLIKKVSGLTGRQNRGRFYLPGIDESSVTEVGVLAAATITLIQGRLNTWLTSVNDVVGITQMVILHQGLGDPPAIGPTIITQLIIDPVVSTQRRRLRR